MKFTLKTIIRIPAKSVYETWLNSEGHTNMTGGKASISDQEGDRFTAWDGYIEGENLELTPNKRIVQTWRTTEFDDSQEDSILEILFEEDNGETLITLNHSNLPADGEHYKKGWQDYYFEPMKKYFFDETG